MYISIVGLRVKLVIVIAMRWVESVVMLGCLELGKV